MFRHYQSAPPPGQGFRVTAIAQTFGKSHSLRLWLPGEATPKGWLKQFSRRSPVLRQYRNGHSVDEAPPPLLSIELDEHGQPHGRSIYRFTAFVGVVILIDPAAKKVFLLQGDRAVELERKPDGVITLPEGV